MEPSVVRIRMRPIIVVVALMGMFFMLVCPLIIAVTVLIFARVAIGIPVALGCLVFSAGMGYAMSSSFQWVELEGNIIRGQRLLTRTIVEHQVADLVDAAALHSKAMGHVENAILDAMLKTSNRGYELRFQDGSKIGLVRGDMAGLDDFLGALAGQIGKTAK